MRRKALAAMVVVLSLIGGLSGCGKKTKVAEEPAVNSSQDVADVKKDIQDLEKEIGDISDFIKEFSEAANIGLEEQEKEEEAKTATSEEIKNAYSEYVFSVFETNGKLYRVEDDSDVQFYSDVTCTNEIQTPRFLSETINDSAVAKNGLNPHSLLAENGTIVYCTEMPCLVEVEAK